MTHLVRLSKDRSVSSSVVSGVNILNEKNYLFFEDDRDNTDDG